MLHNTNHSGYSKDVATGAVINKNSSEYAVYQNQKQMAKEYQNLRGQLAHLMEQLTVLQTERKQTSQ